MQKKFNKNFMQNNQNTNIEENEVQEVKEESFEHFFKQIDPTQSHIFSEVLKFIAQ
jgi:hypothetical protein